MSISVDSGHYLLTYLLIIHLMWCGSILAGTSCAEHSVFKLLISRCLDDCKAQSSTVGHCVLF